MPPTRTHRTSPFIPYEQVIETDHYLWRTGEVGKLLKGEVIFSVTMPMR